MQIDVTRGVPDYEIRPLSEGDRNWVIHLLREHWGSERSISRGRIHTADRLPGFLAVRNGERIGLLTYRFENSECEIVTLNRLSRDPDPG